MTPQRQPVAMKANPKSQGEIRALPYPDLWEEVFRVTHLKKDDLELAYHIDSLNGMEQVDKLPPEVKDDAKMPILVAGKGVKAHFLDRVYQAIVVDNDLEFLDQLIRVVEYLKKRNATNNPSGAAIKYECARAGVELIINNKLPTHDQIKKRLRERGIRVDGFNWSRIWRELRLDDPKLAGARGRPKKRNTSR